MMKIQRFSKKFKGIQRNTKNSKGIQRNPMPNQIISKPPVSRILQNPSKTLKTLSDFFKTFEILEDLEIFLRDLHSPARNLPARPKSSISQGPGIPVPRPWHTQKIIFADMHGFEIADSGCFWISLRFQISSTE